jgi:outer membrane protein assembly factor BamB
VATDGKMVFAYFGPEGLYAYDVDGRPAWKIVEPFHTLGLGTGASPVLFGDTVIIQRDQDKATSAVIAYDKATGKEVWKTMRPVQISWSTPVLVEAGGRTELVTNGSEHVIGYDAATGQELWRTRGVRSNAIHTPLVGKGLVVVTAGFPAKRIIAIRPGDVPEDRAGRVGVREGHGVRPLEHPVSRLHLPADRQRHRDVPRRGDRPKIVYEGGRPPVPSNFMGSPVAFGDYIAMTSDEGTTYMLRAGPKHEIVRANSIDEPVYSSLAPPTAASTSGGSGTCMRLGSRRRLAGWTTRRTPAPFSIQLLRIHCVRHGVL